MHFNITSPEKIIWPLHKITKRQYIFYLLKISPYLLPFLQNRLLTVIRFPNGITGESFYQKHCPKYASDFMEMVYYDGERYMVCNNIYSLSWLGNQLAIELHIPFSLIGEQYPFEIVFDLDPPSKEDFSLAIRAAKEIHIILNNFNIYGFPKLSGNKGIQVHIPLSSTFLTYDETRIFTEFIAQYLVEKFPDLFTIERLKKNRNNRLYIDYVQHAEGKTIIAPYSTRGNENAQVAAPLNWSDLTEDLTPSKYTMMFVLENLTTKPCPFNNYFTCDNQALRNIINQLKSKR